MTAATKTASTHGEANTPTVLIVGAGPTGLTLACELARRGVSLRLIEAAAGPQPGSRGKGVQPRTLEVFDDLGIVERVLAHGRAAMPMRFTGADGEVFTRQAEIPDDQPDIPYPATVITPQWRVEEALRLRLTELGRAVEFGTTLVGFDQSDSGVRATVQKNGQTEIIAADWLVGCDGGRSVVRKQAGIAFEGETLEALRMIVADVEVDGLDRDAWHVWQNDDGMLALCPLPSTAGFQYQAGLGPEQNPELTLANLQAMVDARSGRTDLRLREPSWSSLWRANIRLVERYREGRVFLAGDAAHIHSPAGGQGMNTGIQDACNLGWKLAAVANGAAPALLDSYAVERWPVAAGVLALSNEILNKVVEQKRIVVDRSAGTTQLGINYRGSVLAHDDRVDDAPLRAGDRAPDATGLIAANGERRLFDLTRGGHFTLLAFGAVPAIDAAPFVLRTFRVVARPQQPDEIADREGQLARAYAATAGTLVLIRPDGYIALISDAGDATVATNYFAAMR